MKFSEVKYERPDIEAYKAFLKDNTEKFKNAKTYEEARSLFVEADKKSKEIDSLSTISHIRHSIDTRDKFYEEENNFWNEEGPLLEEYAQNQTKAMLESPFIDDFEREFGDIIFLNARIALKAFSPEIIPDSQRENQLVQDYENLLAKAQIDFEGQKYTISQMTPFKTDPDDERRLAAWKAEGAWYKDNQDKLDGYYDELVKLRDKMGKTLGYEGYTELGYYRMKRNCYTKEDVEKYREAVVKFLVPVAEKAYKKQAEILGKDYPLSFADAALEFRSGNPKPQGSPDEIIAQGKKFYEELSPETGAFFNAMIEGELMDVLSKEGKRGGGYCTSIFSLGMPFIFANFNGTQGDVEVVTHEAGHAFSFYMNRDRIPAELAWPGMEACEVHSMSMEFFAWKNAEGFFGSDAKKFKYSHLASALKFIPYGTMVDHFQHIVYEKPELSPRQRHDEWKRLLGIYMPWMKLDGEIPFYSDGEGWQRQHHIYSYPFYYIDYCLAQVVALQFWAKIQENPAKAWECYMAYTKQGGTQVFTKLLENSGLESPFGEECFKEICSAADKWLDEFDMTGIE